jgi:alpha-tubulin suppressor-like RCC1 family protein
LFLHAVDPRPIAAGFEHTCILTSAGAVRCWDGNQVGQLGNGTKTDSPTPVDVSGLSSGVIAIATGGFHTCILTSAGAVKCWGGNRLGQLGNGTNTDSATPVAVSGLGTGVSTIATGERHTCILTSNGRAKCWGRNFNGQLGDGTTTDRWTPVDLP